MDSALPVAAGDVFLLLLLYACSTCITWMASDRMSKTASITTRTQATVSLGLIRLPLEERVLQGSSSVEESSNRIYDIDQMT